MIRIGTASRAIPRELAERFPAEGSSLARTAARFSATELNSSFHRSHRRSIYERWASEVPDDFAFSVKLPKEITHKRRLLDCEPLLDAFTDEAGGLGAKWAVSLVQLPPSFVFDAAVAARFLGALAARATPAVACEPRHPSWFEPEADALLAEWRVARVAADPARVPAATAGGGWPGLLYIRLHGSPVIYRSSYDAHALARHAAALARARHAGAQAWCIFDNTASSAAVGNALDLADAVAFHAED